MDGESFNPILAMADIGLIDARYAAFVISVPGISHVALPSKGKEPFNFVERSLSRYFNYRRPIIRI